MSAHEFSDMITMIPRAIFMVVIVIIMLVLTASMSTKNYDISGAQNQLLTTFVVERISPLGFVTNDFFKPDYLDNVLPENSIATARVTLNDKNNALVLEQFYRKNQFLILRELAELGPFSFTHITMPAVYYQDSERKEGKITYEIIVQKP